MSKLTKHSTFFHSHYVPIIDKPKDVDLVSVCPESEGVMNFLDGEEMTLWKGSDGNWYTSYEDTQTFGDYATTDVDIYGMFSDSEAATKWIEGSYFDAREASV